MPSGPRKSKRKKRESVSPPRQREPIMPSIPQKKKLKQKNKGSVSLPPHQNGLRSNVQMLKAPPSQRNGRKGGKEKHYLAELEAEGNWDSQVGEEKAAFIFNPFKILAAAGDMAVIESEGMNWTKGGGKKKNHLAVKEANGNQNRQEGEEKTPFLFIADEIAEAGEMAAAIESEDSPISPIPTEIVQSEVQNPQFNIDDLKMFPLEKSREEIQETKNLEHGTSNGFHEHSMTSHVDAGQPMEAPQNDETDTVTLKTEILAPPMVARRASIWNCCCLFEVFKSFRH